jgi:cell division protein FtsW (lipid II flippase)
MDINEDIIVNPNASKEFLKNLMSIFILIIAIIGLLIFLQAQVGPDLLTDLLLAFDIQVSTVVITLIISLIFILGAGILLLFNYTNIKNQKYILYNDRIDYTGTQTLLFLQKETIPYQNIIRITFSNEGIFNKLLSCGEVKIELSGLKIPEITLESIDGPEKLTDLIQQKVNQFNMQKQMRFQEQRKIEGIMKKF